jgi:RNA polymerase sigma-70 factor (ECF subfamily)
VDDRVADALFVERLRAGDEAVFTRVFEEHQPVLLRLARVFVKSPSIAEEVVQDTWVAVIDALDGFEGRSTFKTWIARIAVNRAKTRAARDGRSVPLSALEDEEGAGEPAVEAARFLSSGLWAEWPTRWAETPETLALLREVREAVEETLGSLPEAQRAVVTLRDLEGWTAEEVCNALEVSESNQRVLLHRGRARLRAVLEQVLEVGKRS